MSLLTDHMVFAPKYRGKMLVGDVAMICEGIILRVMVKSDLLDLCNERGEFYAELDYPFKILYKELKNSNIPITSIKSKSQTSEQP